MDAKIIAESTFVMICHQPGQTCANGTIAAKDIWPNDVPYLQRESCGAGRHSPHYRTEYRFSIPEFAALLGIAGHQPHIVKIGERNESGRVLWVWAGPKKMRGESSGKNSGLPPVIFYGVSSFG